MSDDPTRYEPVPLHTSPSCTCDHRGENPGCPDHGYEAVIWRLRVENDRMRCALEAIQELVGMNS